MAGSEAGGNWERFMRFLTALHQASEARDVTLECWAALPFHAQVVEEWKQRREAWASLPYHLAGSAWRRGSPSGVRVDPEIVDLTDLFSLQLQVSGEEREPGLRGRKRVKRKRVLARTSVPHGYQIVAEEVHTLPVTRDVPEEPEGATTNL